MQDAKRTKEYFKVVFQKSNTYALNSWDVLWFMSAQKLERDLQESQISGRPQNDGQDRLSLLPNKLSLKVSLNLCDVAIK